MSLRLLLPVIVGAGMLLGVEAAQAQETSRSTFAKLIDVQELWGEENYNEALRVLQKLAADNSDDPYDHAVTQQYIAQTALFLDRMDLVRSALETALAQPVVDEKFSAELKLFYGQVVMGDEEFEKAQGLLEDWYAYVMQNPEANAQPTQIFSLAYANYMTGNLARAEVLLEEVIASANTVNDTWNRVYYQVLFEQAKYDAAEVVVYGLASRDPGNETYWRMLVNHYLRVEDSRKALASMAVADLQGLLDEPIDRERLASMYGFSEIPEKAARIIEAAVAEDKMQEDAKTLRRLGDLWLLARDRGRALDYLSRAAAASPDGNTYELVGSLLFEDEQWEHAHDAYMLALNLGGLDQPERVQLLAGMSAFRAGNMQAARESFDVASKSEEYRAQALAMLRQLNES